MICSNNRLFENQITKLKAFMSWNGFPRAIRSLLIAKLRDKHSNQREQLSSFDHENDDRPKIWMRIPYLGKRGETLVKKCIKKIRRNLTQSVNFMVIYENKKIAYFLPNKDKIPKLSKSKIIYQITCPGCSNSYIGKTERCLKSRLSERSDPTKSAVGHHFCNCENVRHIVGMHHLLTTLTTKQLTQTMFLSLFLILSSITLKLFTLPILKALYIKYRSQGQQRTYAFCLIFSVGHLSSCHNTHTLPH